MENWLGYSNGSVYNYQDGTVHEFLEEAMKNAPSQLEVTKKNISYYNIPASFDIETSSFRGYEEHGNEVKKACMYIWQFGLNGSVIYGRTWDEFFEMLAILQESWHISNKKHLIIYVHNLSYEFQFLKKWIEWDKIFAVKQRRPVYAIAGGFEFRCSLILSNYALAYIGDHLLYKYPMEKKVGDLDYLKLRHSETPLTPSELGYCINDVKVVMCYIQQKIEEDGDITKIPLTNTGYVREYCRNWCFYSNKLLPEDKEKNKKEYHALMKSLKISSPEEYYQMERAFAGGFTHASALHANQVLRNVGSADLTSSYPYHMIAEYYPINSFKYIGIVEDNRLFNYYIKNYCCMFDVTFINIRPAVTFENPISRSRCIIDEDKNYQVNNGRIVSADELTTTLTELDWDTIYKFYTWDEVKIFNMRVASRGYLPKDLILAILHLYGNKTSLKGIEEKHVEYMVSKNMINASFGMMVTAIIRDEFVFDDDWHKIAPDISSQLEAYNNSYNRFLYYGWGIWVTAHARHSLFKAIYEFDEDYVYADTDSVKILNPEKHKDYFDSYNAEIMRKIQRVAKFRGQDPKMYMPKNPKGKDCILGVWDFEGVFDEFKTLGAKRYLYREDDEYTLTVAGTNKKKSCEYLVSTGDPFGSFSHKLKIPAESTGKNILTYIDDPITGILVDQNGVPYEYEELSSVHMEAAEYNLSLSEDFIRYLKGGVDFGE